jgi:glyoxylase-like metal-dependent hydrolase (beta-lactamase superfamily II)
MNGKSEITVQQLRVHGFDDNFSYLVYAENGDAAIVDPCGTVSIIREAVQNASIALKPQYILLTHTHHDHISGIDRVLDFFPGKVAAHPNSGINKDIALDDRQVLPFGDTGIECLHTPGHSPDSVCFRIMDDSGIFTGDTLFIDWCGYCNAETMFKTMRKVLFPLADSLIVWSGHDYGHAPSATLGEEKVENPYLRTTDFEQFKKELRNL